MDETEKNQPAPLPAPRKTFGTATKEWAAIRYKEVKPWFEWLSGWVGEKKVPLKEVHGLLTVLALLLIGATVWATHRVERGHFDRRVDATNALLRASFTSSNSFLHGEIAQLVKTIESKNSEIAKLTAEVGKLTTEKESLHVRNTMLLALPETATGLYSSTTNLLSGFGSIPQFSFEIDGRLATNGVTIPLTERTFDMRVRNVSETSADQLGISLYLPVEFGSTNLTGTGWEPNLQMMMEIRDKRDGQVKFMIPKADQWIWKADSPVAPGFGRKVNSISISTNYTGKRLDATFYIYAARSGRHEFKVAFVFE